MIHFLKATPTAAWLLLMILTLLGFSSAEYGTIRGFAVVIMMLLSTIKARTILYRFMEVNELPLPLQLFFNGWLVVCTGLIVGLFIVSL